MKKVFVFVLAAVLWIGSHSHPQAAFLAIQDSWRVDRANNTVSFQVLNRSTGEISQIFGWVYGFNRSEKPDFELVNNPHQAPVKITPGPHSPGTLATYRFDLLPAKNDKRFYGLLVYDRSVFYNTRNPR